MNDDTDLLADTKALIPADDQFFYTGDSIITYNFRTQKGDEEIYLNGYSEEVHCLIERTAAEEYFVRRRLAEVLRKGTEKGRNKW